LHVVVFNTLLPFVADRLLYVRLNDILPAYDLRKPGA
jgi:hypothetical protein